MTFLQLRLRFRVEMPTQREIEMIDRIGNLNPDINLNHKRASRTFKTYWNIKYDHDIRPQYKLNGESKNKGRDTNITAKWTIPDIGDKNPTDEGCKLVVE